MKLASILFIIILIMLVCSMNRQARFIFILHEFAFILLLGHKNSVSIYFTDEKSDLFSL